jgi:predicted RNA-binding Zn ribbon-like protein
MQPGVHMLTGGRGGRYPFDPGTLCLELLVSGGFDRFVEFELFTGPDTLARWLPGTRLALDAPLTPADFPVRAADLARFKHLRGVVWTVASALVRQESPAAADLEIVNGYAEEAPRPRVDPATRQRRWVTPITGPQALGAFARDAVDMVTGTARVGECSASNCALVFLDTSRPGSRRWCSMERCGNRNKVRTHRARATR